MTPVVHSNGHATSGLSSPPAKSRPLPSASAAAEIQIVFQNADGATLRGTPLHFNRHTAVWELYQTDSAPRLSETLANFKIIFQERTVYAGRAVISNLLDAGGKIICDATLDEANWNNLDFSSPPKDGLVANEFKNFSANGRSYTKFHPNSKSSSPICRHS